MHPAPSIILFSTLSGAGFGLLALLGFGFAEATGSLGFWHFFLGYALAVSGLISSTFHLGHPERAILALSQWRTSWLSREGIAAIAGLSLLAPFAIGTIFFSTTIPVIGWVAGAIALFTVLTTAMIYTQMKTVPRWRDPSTPILFLILAIAGGATFAGLRFIALPALALAAAVQVYWWISGDSRFARAGHNMASATGLAPDGGKIRQFAPPHTGSNYLMKEMIHVIGRKHAAKLRLIALIAGFGLPILVLLFTASPLGAAIAGLIHLGGVFASRWLFFAEAEHVVGLYYGQIAGRAAP